MKCRPKTTETTSIHAVHICRKCRETCSINLHLLQISINYKYVAMGREVSMSLGVTLVLYCEVSGDQRWNLSSDVCAVDLPPSFYLVILNDLSLKQRINALQPNHRRTRTCLLCQTSFEEWLSCQKAKTEIWYVGYVTVFSLRRISRRLTMLGIESGSSFFWGGPASPPGAPGKAPGMPGWGPGWGPAMCPPNWPIH